MCPEHEILERLALGLLSDEELAPLEEHLETCHECLQTLLGTDPSDIVIEALRAAPQTLERRAEIADDIRRVEAAVIAQLRKPWREEKSQVQSPRSKVGKSGDDRYLTTPPPSVVEDTSAFGSRFSRGSERPEPRTELDEDDDLRDFLSPPEAADEMGRLGGYRVLRVLGSGGMGVVFEAEDPLLKRHVALKVMKPSVASISARKRFLREAQTAAAVEHDHIVPVYQVGEDRGVPFITMPLLRGQTLAERLDSVGNGLRAVPPAADERRQASGGLTVQGSEERVDVEPRAYSSHLAPRDVTDHAQRDHLSGEAASLPLSSDRHAGAAGQVEGGPLPTLANDAAEEIANRKLDERGENLPLSPRPPHGALRNEDLTRIGREIALGLAAAHRRGLIHRDIKPSNIWLEEETDRVKILDFGLARVVDSAEQLTHAGTLLGTPAYMSPEQASGVEADARSDLFSLGCVLYHAATGRRPFLGRDALTTLLAVTTTEPPAPSKLNPSLPDALNDLIVSLLSKDPARRPQTAREVAEKLDGIRHQVSGVRRQEEEFVGSALRGVSSEGSAEQLDVERRAYSSHHAPRDGTDHAERDQSSGGAALLPLRPDPPAGAPGRGEGVLNEAVLTIDSVAATAAASPDLLAHAVPSKTPPARRVFIALAAAAAVLIAGIVITIKNEKGETIAQFETNQPFEMTNLAPRHTATVASSDKVAPTLRGGDAVAKGDRLAPPSRSAGATSPPQPPTPNSQPLSAMSLVTAPAPIPGATSWTLETLDHRGDIFKMEFNPDGTLLATYGEDGAVRLWNSETGELARIFVGADSPSGGIAFSPDGAAIAVAAGGKIKAWNAATGKTVCTVALVDGEAASLAWSPDGKTFAVGQRPIGQPEAPARQLCLYDTASGKLIADRHRDDWNVEQIAWSPDGKRLLIDDHQHLSWLFDIRANAVHSVAVPTDGGGRHLSWTADGIPLVAGTNQHAFCVWRAQPLELLHRFAPPAESTYKWHALSSDGQFAVGGLNWDGHALWYERGASVFDCATGQRVRGFDRLAASKDTSGWEAMPRYAISRDGRRVARRGPDLGGPAMLDMDTGDAIWRRALITGHHNVNFLGTWLDDDTVAFVTAADAACLCDARMMYPRAISARQAGLISDLRRSSDGRRFTMVNYRDGDVRQYSSNTAETIQVSAATPEIPRLSDDGELIAARIESGHVRILDSARCRPLKTLDAVTDTPVTWSPDKKRIAVSHRGATEIWDIDANAAAWRSDAGTGFVTWSPDGTRFVFGSAGEATIHDLESGNALHSLDDAPAPSLAEGYNHWPRMSWSPDGRLIAGCGRIWDADTGDVIARLPHAALAGEIGAPAWSPDGATLAYLGPGRAVVIVGWALPTTRTDGLSIQTDDHRPTGRSTPAPSLTAMVGNAHPTANSAPKVRHSTAQGETLGHVHARNAVALKGRDSDASPGVAVPGESRPVGANNSNVAPTQGSAALHPGLWNVTPSGSPQVAAMLLTFNRGQMLSIAPSGHYRASPRADELLVYVVETPDGQETLSRQQFAERFGWKNNPAWATNVAPTLRGGDAVAKGDRLAPPSRSAAATLGDLALVQRPAALPGVESWTIARRSPPVGTGWQPISLSGDGKWLAQAGADGIVRLTAASSGKVERLFVGHGDPLAAVAFSSDGKLIASLDSIAGNVRIWDAATARQIHSVYAGRSNWIGALHFSPDTKVLAISVTTAPLKLLDVGSGEFLPQPIGHERLWEPDYFAWSPDGRRFVSTTGGNREIRIWDTATLESVLTLESKFDSCPYVAFGWSPDGAMLAAYAQGEIRVWDTAAGKLLKKFKEEHGAWNSRVAWLPGSKQVVITTDNPFGCRLWDVVDGRPLGDILDKGRRGQVDALAVSNQGQMLAMHRNQNGWTGLVDLPSSAFVSQTLGSALAESAAWSPDGRELAVTGHDMAVWSNNKHRGLAMLPTGNLSGAAWSAQLGTILNNHNDRNVYLYDRRGQHWDKRQWDKQQWEKLSIADMSTVALSPDGNRLACPSRADIETGRKCPIEIWDVATGKRLVRAEPLAQSVRGWAWSPDQTLLAVGTDDGKSAIYETARGKQLAELPAARAQIRPLMFSPDGKTIAAGYGGGGQRFVRLYDVGALAASVGSALRGIPAATDGPSSVRKATDGERDAGPRNATEGVPYRDAAEHDDSDPKSGSRSPGDSPKSEASPEPKADGTRSVPATLKLIRELTCNSGPQDPEVLALHWSPDGRTLHVLDRAAVYIFDTATGERLAEAPRLDRTPHAARPANFSPDGRFLAVATTCTRVWDLAELNAAAEVAPTLRGGEAVAKGDRLAPPSRSAAATLKLVASVVPLGHGQAVVVSADGHWLGTRGAEKEIVYVIKTAAGQETLTPREFYKRFGWKNDPSKVVLP